MTSAILQLSKQAAGNKELAAEFALHLQKNTEAFTQWLSQKFPDLSPEDRRQITQNKYTVRDDESLSVGMY